MGLFIPLLYIFLWDHAAPNSTLKSVEVITRVARALPGLEAGGLARAGDFPLLLRLGAILNHGAALDLPWERFF